MHQHRWRSRRGRVRASPGAIATLIAASQLCPARAAANNGHEACHGPRIVVAPTLKDPWRDVVEQARAELSLENDLDRCAYLVVEPIGEELRVRVTLADGRSTARQVLSPSALLLTLQALLSLPPPERRMAPPALEGSEVSGADSPVEVAPQTPDAALHPHLELGIGGMVRTASSPIYGGLGLAAFAQLNLARWLVGVSAHWDASDVLLADAAPSGFNMQTLALGVHFGIRSSFRGLTLDALLGPQVRIENQEAFGGETAADGIGGGTSDIRLDAALRLLTPHGGAVRFFTEADIDASPARLHKARRLDTGLPTLPAWSAGLALGALWSLP